ncbi:MAG: hypothetical protein ACOX5W_01015 [Bacillota bacterium]|jgi:hypothetical protein
MIFASDLDRTLIYSEKFLQGYVGQVRAVESGQYNSYMTQRATGLLRQIARCLLFIPCTTRTIEQYQRIQFFQTEVIPRYALASNGANLLVEGAVDRVFQKSIFHTLANECLAGPEIIKEFGRLASAEWTQPLREADGVFYYCVIDRTKAPRQELARFRDWARKQNWELSIQGRKLYLVPAVINKGTALKRMAEITGDDRIISVGDSLLDLPLLLEAEYAISPAHGELYEELYEQFANSGRWKFTEVSGIGAGEEILELALDYAGFRTSWI